MRDSEEITRPLAIEAKVILLKYLQGKMVGNESVKHALSSIQAHVKMLATEANGDTNKIALAKMIFTEPKLRAEYAKKTLSYLLPGDEQKKLK